MQNASVDRVDNRPNWASYVESLRGLYQFRDSAQLARKVGKVVAVGEFGGRSQVVNAALAHWKHGNWLGMRIASLELGKEFDAPLLRGISYSLNIIDLAQELEKPTVDGRRLLRQVAADGLMRAQTAEPLLASYTETLQLSAKATAFVRDGFGLVMSGIACVRDDPARMLQPPYQP
jgi:hypothetical protein